MPAQSSQPVHKLRILRDVKTPMRDGVSLSSNIFLPGSEGRFPTIFCRMPYGFDGFHIGDGDFYARRGYVLIMQDCRGRYDSDGEFYPFRDDARDGYDSLDWICKQPWSNGRVGMFGPSYLGLVQWLLAVEGHPALQALVPNVCSSDAWKRGFWCDGAFSLALCGLWCGLEISSRTSDLGLIPAYDLRKLFRHLPLKTFDAKAGHPCQLFQDFLAHSRHDEYWAAMSVDGKYDRISAPAFVMGGWYDYYPGEALRNFNGLRRLGLGAARRHTRVIIGPWSHIISTGPKLGEVDFGPESNLVIRELALRWYDAILKDMDTGILDEPSITIFLMGINRWRQEHEWPLARTSFTDYFLHSNGSANTNSEDGILSLAAPNDEPPDRYVYDPNNPVPTLGGNHSICWSDAYRVIQPGPFDQRPVEQRPDVLTYTTRPLEHDTEVTGPVLVKLWASTDGPDTDWTAKLTDVHPDGRSINLTEGVLRARFHEDLYGAPKLLDPGRTYEFTIELLPTSNVFLKGHRIRLDISSSNFPLWDRNPNTGHDVGADAEVRVARQTVFHDAQHKSKLVLPVIP